MSKEKLLKQTRTILVGSPARKRIIYEDAEGRELYFKTVNCKAKVFYVDEELVSEGSDLAPEKIVAELSGISLELFNINEEAKKYTRGISATKVETIKVQLAALKNRADLLTKLLNKSLPDKKTLEHKGTVALNNTIDSIPDDILVAAVAGKLSEEQMEQMELLATEGVGGEH
jgi:hypothetical protein